MVGGPAWSGRSFDFDLVPSLKADRARGLRRGATTGHAVDEQHFTPFQPFDKRLACTKDSRAMSDCPVCKKSVVIDPEVLPDGRIVHGSCKQRWLDAQVADGPLRQPKSGSRIRVALPKKETG